MNLQSEFDSLHQKHQGMVMQLCLGFSQGIASAAQDLSQDVFINVWNALPDFKRQSSYKTWVYRITVNTCLMQIRKQKKMPTESIENQQAGNTADIKEDHNYNQLYVAIGKLAEVDRLVIMLVLDDLGYAEISEIIGISEANLRVKIHRIKAKLKNIMKNE